MYSTPCEFLLYLILYMASPLHQLYTTKLQLAAVVTAVVGVSLLTLSRAVETTSIPLLNWLVGLPTGELGAALVSGGLIGVIFEYYARKESDARTDERFDAAIRRGAPAIRDAVLDSFAFEPAALKNVASGETLDRITTNALGLRLGDQALASDVYTDLRDQVVRSPERWRDVDISVSLAPWKAGPATGRGSMFEITLRCEYRVRPANTTMRFACVSDTDEYRELLRDPTVNAPWYVDPSGGVDAANRQTFELLQLSVDGKPKKIRRTERPGAQLYITNLGTDATEGHEVTIAYTYRILVQRHGHVLYLDLPRPTKGLHVQLDYAGAGIRRINVLDFIASSESARIDQAPESASARTVDIGFDGWIFPRSGVAFVWVLDDELTASTDSLASSSIT